jgi:hypothetical protein
MTTYPTAEYGASEELIDVYGTRYVRDAGTGAIYRVGPKGLKKRKQMLNVEHAGYETETNLPSVA